MSRWRAGWGVASCCLATALVSCARSTRVASTPANSWEWLPAANAKPADSTCADVLTGGRTISDTFHLHVQVGMQSRDEPTRIFQRTLVQDVLSFITLPDTLLADFAWAPDTTAWRRVTPAPSSSSRIQRQYETTLATRSELDASVSFRLTREGRVDSMVVMFPSQLPAIHESFVAAVLRADSASAFPPIPDNLVAPQQFIVGLLARERPEPDSRPFRSVQIRAPIYTKPIRIIKMRGPRFPAERPRPVLTPMVMTSFVVDVDSSVRRESVRILNDERPDWVRAVGQGLASATFEPAEYRGCPLASRIQLLFEFSNRPGP